MILLWLFPDLSQEPIWEQLKQPVKINEMMQDVSLNLCYTRPLNVARGTIQFEFWLDELQN